MKKLTGIDTNPMHNSDQPLDKEQWFKLGYQALTTPADNVGGVANGGKKRKRGGCC